MIGIKNNIELKNLTAGYSKNGTVQEVLKNISLSAKAGELIALIGINGSGKSTLLRTIVNFQKAISGTISVNGLPVNSYKLNDLARLVSFVSTEKIDTPQMTARELVSLGRFPYTDWFGGLSDDDKKIIEQVIVKTGIGGYIHKNIPEISDGERQRCMIARALVQDTGIIVLDEPTAFLDIKNRIETIQLLKTLTVENKKTIIYSTHELGIALQMADKIWLVTGSGISEGAPEDLVLNNQISSVFSSENISFDNTKGDFVYQADQTGKVHLSGEGTHYEWTKKALQRGGFAISQEACHISVKIISENGLVKWEVNQSGEICTVNSIYGLMEKISKRFFHRELDPFS